MIFINAGFVPEKKRFNDTVNAPSMIHATLFIYLFIAGAAGKSVFSNDENRKNETTSFNCQTS